MLSRGGKREYTCPTCSSGNIYKALTKNFGAICVCRDCDGWVNWSGRIKKPTKGTGK